MFGPTLPIHARVRIYRRRLLGAHVVAAAILAVTLLVVDYEPDPYVPAPRMGYLGPTLIVERLDELREEVAEQELLAGGHPLPQALEAVQIEIELTHEAPDLTVDERLGEMEKDIPEIEEPREGPVEGEHLAAREAAPLSIRSREIVVLKFVKPSYPADAKLLGIQGMVMVKAFVGVDGEVKETVTHTDDDLLPSCIKAARQAAEKWRFAPLVQAGEPRAFWVEIPFRFLLGGRVVAGT